MAEICPNLMGTINLEIQEIPTNSKQKKHEENYIRPHRNQIV